MKEEEMKNKMKEIEKDIDNKISEKYKLQEEYYEMYELPRLRKKYLNKYFIYRNNSYSCPETEDDYWNVYYKIIEITKNGSIQAIELQKDKYGKIESNITTMSPNLEEIEEITEKEYIRETSKILGELQKRYK